MMMVLRIGSGGGSGRFGSGGFRLWCGDGAEDVFEAPLLDPPFGNAGALGADEIPDLGGDRVMLARVDDQPSVIALIVRLDRGDPGELRQFGPEPALGRGDDLEPG